MHKQKYKEGIIMNDVVSGTTEVYSEETRRQPVGKTPKKFGIKQGRQTLFLFCMLALPLLQWIVFWFYVNVQSIVLAFQDPQGAFTFANFASFFDELTVTTGKTIGVAVKNTMIYFSVGVLIQLPGALFIAYFLYKKILFFRVYRVLFYLPAIISGVVMVAAYRSIVDPNGPLEALMQLMGKRMPPEGYLARPESATLMIVLYVIWTGFGGNMLLFGGAMSRVPLDLLESARLEGCGPFRELVQIILPLIWPTISTMLIFTFTGIVNSSGPILLFTNGDFETTTINFWIFLKVYGQQGNGAGGDYGVVSATGLCFTLVTVPLILFVRRLLEKVPTVEY